MGPTELNRAAARWTATWGVATLVSLTAACAAAPDGSGREGGGACQPGAASACMCGDGSMAAATCDPTGSVLGPCACPAGVAPMGTAGNMLTTPAVPPPTPTTTTPTPTTPTPTTPTPTTPPASDPMMGAAGAPAMDPVMDPVDPMMDPMTEPVAPGDEVPAGEHCAAVATWEPAWTAFEDEVLRLTNEWRAKGADCGSMGTFGPAGPLTMSAMLRCSSRLHSQDMGMQDYFAHTNLAGEDPFDRMADAGYMGFTMGENIAKGQQTPKEVVDGWIDSDGHCSNIMNDGFTEIGVGYWEGEADSQFFNGNKLWTQNFGAPGGGGGWPR